MEADHIRIIAEKVKQYEGSSKRGMTAEVDLSARCEPAQPVNVILFYGKGCF